MNNLPAIEKILETYFLSHIEEHIKNNNIFHIQLHGGRRDHSTITAMTIIYNKLLYNKENSIISTIFCTDLSAAYDTVNTDILLEKLEYYGFRDKEYRIFQSYFTNRKQFVCLDTFNSLIIDSPSSGCVQGSKMSSSLYNLYISEVPDLHNSIYQNFLKT